jgi:hypothetical protein
MEPKFNLSSKVDEITTTLHSLQNLQNGNIVYDELAKTFKNPAAETGILSYFWGASPAPQSDERIMRGFEDLKQKITNLATYSKEFSGNAAEKAALKETLTSIKKLTEQVSKNVMTNVIPYYNGNDTKQTMILQMIVAMNQAIPHTLAAQLDEIKGLQPAFPQAEEPIDFEDMPAPPSYDPRGKPSTPPSDIPPTPEAYAKSGWSSSSDEPSPLPTQHTVSDSSSPDRVSSGDQLPKNETDLGQTFSPIGEPDTSPTTPREVSEKVPTTPREVGSEKVPTSPREVSEKSVQRETPKPYQFPVSNQEKSLSPNADSLQLRGVLTDYESRLEGAKHAHDELESAKANFARMNKEFVDTKKDYDELKKQYDGLQKELDVLMGGPPATEAAPPKVVVTPGGPPPPPPGRGGPPPPPSGGLSGLKKQGAAQPKPELAKPELTEEMKLKADKIKEAQAELKLGEVEEKRNAVFNSAIKNNKLISDFRVSLTKILYPDVEGKKVEDAILEKNYSVYVEETTARIKKLSTTLETGAQKSASVKALPKAVESKEQIQAQTLTKANAGIKTLQAAKQRLIEESTKLKAEYENYQMEFLSSADIGEELQKKVSDNTSRTDEIKKELVKNEQEFAKKTNERNAAVKALQTTLGTTESDPNALLELAKKAKP